MIPWNKGKQIKLEKCQGCGISLDAHHKFFCSKECCIEFRRTHKRQKLSNCVSCGKILFGNKLKYCSRKCSDKSKILNTIKECRICHKSFVVELTQGGYYKSSYYCSRKCQRISSQHKNRKCLMCERHVKDPMSKYCSRECFAKKLTMEPHKNHLRGNVGYRIDIPFSHLYKSSLEADFARYLCYKGIIFDYESKRFTVNLNGKETYYTPDFYFPEKDVYIDVKGKKDKNLCTNIYKIEQLQKDGHKIYIVTQKDFVKMLRRTGLWKIIPNLENRNNDKNFIGSLICDDKKDIYY